jgi:hypothetical protein
VAAIVYLVLMKLLPPRPAATENLKTEN